MADGNSCEKSVRPMSGSEFKRLSEFIHSQCGIKMPPAKKAMLEARLQKRLKSLGITLFEEYCDYLFNFNDRDSENELVQMINAVTTNKTDFFREPVHFHFLTETVLPEYISTGGTGKKFTVWSAGCSTGEEPYSLAMVLNECALRFPEFRFSILATDISTQVLEQARLGIYEQEQAEAIPPHLRKKYLMRSKDRSKKLVRIVPRIRSLVCFDRLNLIDEHLGLPQPADAIFCRNVIIYFEREEQEKLLGCLCHSLKPGGHLFLGHSETVVGFNLPLICETSKVYRKVE